METRAPRNQRVDDGVGVVGDVAPAERAGLAALSSLFSLPPSPRATADKFPFSSLPSVLLSVCRADFYEQACQVGSGMICGMIQTSIRHRRSDAPDYCIRGRPQSIKRLARHQVRRTGSGRWHPTSDLSCPLPSFATIFATITWSRRKTTDFTGLKHRHHHACQVVRRGHDGNLFPVRTTVDSHPLLQSNNR